MSTLKRVILKRDEYTKKEQNRMRSIHRCFLNAMPDEGLPDLLKMNEDFTLSTHHIDEIHIKKSTWIADMKEHGFLQTEADSMVGHLCWYMNIRWKRLLGKNGNTNDPYNLVCYELLTWLTNTLSRAPCNQNTLDMVKKRCDYLNNLLNSGAFKPGRHHKDTMRSTLIRVKNTLEGRVILTIKREIANTHAREHLENLQNFGKIILSNGFRFLYHIFNCTENTPPPNITRFRRNEDDYKTICATRVGLLLTTLVESPHFTPFFEEEHQKKGDSAIASLDTINTSSSPRKISLRALQTSSNPFLDTSNKSCIPRSLMQNQNIQAYLNPPNTPKHQTKEQLVGIYLTIQQNPKLIEAYMEMHAILVELAKIFLACDEAKALAGIGGDLLVYGISNHQINRLMDTLTKICTRLLDCQKTLVTLCDQIYEPLTHENKTTDKKNVHWVKNYEKIASLQRKLEQSTNKCIGQASLVKEKSNIIPSGERIKHAQKQTRHFAQSTEQLNHQVEYFLKREPTPPLPSQQLTWKSAQLKHTPQNSALGAMEDTPRVELLEEDDEPTPPQQLKYSLRTSLTNLRNLVRRKNMPEQSAEDSDEAQNGEPESKPQLSRSLRNSKSRLSSLFKPGAMDELESNIEDPELQEPSSTAPKTSPRKQLHGSLRKSLTKLFKLNSSGQNSKAGSTTSSAASSAQNSPQLPRAHKGPTTVSVISVPPKDSRKIQRTGSAPADANVFRERRETISGPIGGSSTTAAQPPRSSLHAVVRKKGTESFHTSTEETFSRPVETIHDLLDPPAPRKIELFGDATTEQFLDDNSVRWMLDIFFENIPKATEIHLQRNKLTGKGAVQLCELLSRHTMLEKLICSSNKALLSWCTCDELQYKGWAGANAFSQFIESHACLKELNISDCGLNSAGVQYLARGLKNNRALEFLDISDNPIDANGINYLCDALRYHPSLNSLMIMGIKLNDECGERLCELLENNQHITFLGFNEANNFSETMTQRIYELLSNNRRQNAATLK